MPEHTSARLDEHDRLVRTVGPIATFFRLVVIVVASLLLTSIAGVAVFAAPFTLPLLYLVAAKSHATGWRVAATIVATLTFLEVAWTATWTIWRNPLGSFAVAIAAALAFASPFRIAAQPPNSTDT